jgi:hypothetical protein
MAHVYAYNSIGYKVFIANTVYDACMCWGKGHPFWAIIAVLGLYQHFYHFASIMGIYEQGAMVAQGINMIAGAIYKLCLGVIELFFAGAVVAYVAMAVGLRKDIDGWDDHFFVLRAISM